MEVVCNTVQFKFPAGAPQPSWEEIAEFTKRLFSDPMQMEAVYRLPGRLVCIKYKTEDAMEASLRQNKELIKFHYSNGTVVDVRLSIAGTKSTYVRIFDIAPEVPDNKLATALNEYGKVESVVREKFPAGLGLDHLYNGVRGVYVEIEKEIPPTLEISGWKVRIFYEGLKDKCFLCGVEGHYKDACPQRVSRKKKTKKSGKSVSYAGVVEAGSSTLSDEVVLIEEETIEEEIIQETVVDPVEAQKIEQQRKEAEEAEKTRLWQEKSMAGLTKIANAFQAAMDKHNAAERRAQFAAAGTTSTEMLRPKKTARKS